MTEEDHRELLRILDEVEGKVMLSGYFSPLYDSTLKAPKWHRVDFDIANHAAGGCSETANDRVLVAQLRPGDCNERTLIEGNYFTPWFSVVTLRGIGAHL